MRRARSWINAEVSQKERKGGEKNPPHHPVRMRIATGCTVSMVTGCSPATPASAEMLGTPLSTPRHGSCSSKLSNDGCQGSSSLKAMAMRASPLPRLSLAGIRPLP